MPDSFNGVSINIRAEPLSKRDTAQYTLEHIPYSDNSVLDAGGRQAPPLSVELYFDTAAAYEAFRGQVDNTGSLVYIDGTVTAYLASLERTRRWPNGATEARAEFIIL